MSPNLPAEFLSVPIAHRALHDVAQNRPENSRAAIRAAIDAGYGIEIDLQLSADGQALVFHDYDMTRLTGQSGPIRLQSAAQAAEISLAKGDGETIPTLAEVQNVMCSDETSLLAASCTAPCTSADWPIFSYPGRTRNRRPVAGV